MMIIIINMKLSSESLVPLSTLGLLRYIISSEDERSVELKNSWLIAGIKKVENMLRKNGHQSSTVRTLCM